MKRTPHTLELNIVLNVLEPALERLLTEVLHSNDHFLASTRDALFYFLKIKQNEQRNLLLKTVGCLPRSASFNVAWLDGPLPFIMEGIFFSKPCCLLPSPPKTHGDEKHGPLFSLTHFQPSSSHLGFL